MIIVHPKYKVFNSMNNDTFFNPYDIALIRLNTSVDFARVNGYYRVNTICLPQENDIQENEEMA